MQSVRWLILISMALFGLGAGALFTFPSAQKESVKVRINDVSLVAEVASDARSRARGLSGREALDENTALLFIFDQPDRHGIWMKEMKFPIDIFWIRNGAIADIEEEAPVPASDMNEALLPVYRSDVAAEMVLETNAGFARRFGIRIGDQVKIGEEATEAQVDPPRQESSVPGQEYFIETLRRNPPQGSNFSIVKTLETNSAYKKFSISYESDGLTLIGVMNVPIGPVPQGGFPALILNHGLIGPEIYYSGRGSRREQDFFARRGYVTIHPDYRGHAESSPNPEEHHDFYVGYTRDVLGLIAALKSQNQTLVDVERLGMWGHSMGGGIAARVAVLSPDIRAFVLFAPISADVEDNFYELSKEEVQRLYGTYGGVGDKSYRQMSPLAYFGDVDAPVELHHGIADQDVPISFSSRMFETLSEHNKKAELFTYPGEGHEFAGAWELAAQRSLQFFDRYVKNR